jgi:hypothetical protein
MPEKTVPAVPGMFRLRVGVSCLFFFRFRESGMPPAVVRPAFIGVQCYDSAIVG